MHHLTEPQLKEILKTIRRQEVVQNTAMSGIEFLIRFGGLIPADELDRMEEAIERDCETVEQTNGR